MLNTVIFRRKKNNKKIKCFTLFSIKICVKLKTAAKDTTLFEEEKTKCVFMFHFF